MDLNLEQNKPRRDIDAVHAETWTRRPFPAVNATRPRGVPVVIKQSILNEIHRHGQSAPDVEVCGVLVGDGYQDDSGPFVYPEAGIRGEHAENHAAQVTFTGETWSHIFEIVDRDWPDRRIVGWYHTHPGFGIFLSAMDLYIHESFFAMPEQLAFVYDPHSGDEGVFVWRNGAVMRAEFLVEPDAPEDPPRIPLLAAKPVAASAAAGAVASAGSDRLAQEVEHLRRQQDRLWLAVVSIGSVAVIFPLILVLLLIRGGLLGRAPIRPVRSQPPIRRDSAKPPPNLAPLLPTKASGEPAALVPTGAKEPLPPASPTPLPSGDKAKPNPSSETPLEEKNKEKKDQEKKDKEKKDQEKKDKEKKDQEKKDKEKKDQEPGPTGDNATSPAPNPVPKDANSNPSTLPPPENLEQGSGRNEDKSQGDSSDGPK